MKFNKLEIRLGKSSDLEDVFRLVKDLAVYEKSENEVETTLNTYQTEFKNGTFRILLAEADQQIVGMMLFYDAFSTWKGKMMWLEDFVVLEKLRQSGIGLALFNHLVQIGKTEGYALIKWEVLDWNTPAINFYKKVGARLETNWWDGKYFLN
nr:GNAT family N-acetyltransferase [Saprospiraceae bacterium]